MHRILRIAVSSFWGITGLFAVTVMVDQRILSLPDQTVGFFLVLAIVGIVRLSMYAVAVRCGIEPEPRTRDSITAGFIVTSCAVAYGWLILGILVGTNAVSLSYQSSVKPTYGWISLVLILLSAATYAIDLYRLRKGRLSENKKVVRETTDSESRDLAHHGRA
ncbi:hypothetical protein [Rothia uropygialis]|uniref:hypothetical protein n=1 Tax=Kocuria sp. 36 TaxID=1415402 RepID=UPI00101D97C3|nr:hypothetical protein [Kocuria sp. 36]